MAALPPVDSVPPAATVAEAIPDGPHALIAPPVLPAQKSESAATISLWLIAALPLLQFAVIYLLFKPLGLELAPGMQWGILAAPAAFSLLFANSDRKKLAERGLSAPNIAFALLPPLYLAIRCVTTGRTSVLPLVAWVVLQAAAAAGVYILLPAILATAIRSFS
jgi:hypothetical protein